MAFHRASLLLVRREVSLAMSLLSGGYAMNFQPITECGKDDKDTSSRKGNTEDTDWTTALSKLLTEGVNGLPKKNKDQLETLAISLGDKFQTAIDSGLPTQISYGFVSGYCSGLALKKAGRAFAVVLGMGFVVLQSLQYSGYVQVDHGKLRKDMERILDLDQDGKVGQDDVKIGYDKIMKILEYNLPAGSGFAAGFLGGLRSG